MDRLTTEQAAQYLDVHPTTLIGWRGVGRGPEFIKIGHKVRYSQAALEAYIKRQTFTKTGVQPPRKVTG